MCQIIYYHEVIYYQNKMFFLSKECDALIVCTLYIASIRQEYASSIMIAFYYERAAAKELILLLRKRISAVCVVLCVFRS